MLDLIIYVKVALLMLGFILAVSGGCGFSLWERDDNTQPVVLMLYALLAIGVGGFL